MPAPLVGALFSLVSNGLSTALDWKREDVRAELKKAEIQLNEKQLEYMKKMIEARLQMFMAQNQLKIDSDFRDFVTEYEGAAKDLPPFVQILRASIRPLITIWAVGLMSYLMFAAPETLSALSTNLKNMPADLWNIFMIVFGFWFGGRALQHVIDRHTEGRVQERQAEAQGHVQVAAEQTKQESLKAGSAAADTAVGTTAAESESPKEPEKPRDRYTQEEVDKAFRSSNYIQDLDIGG